MSIIWLIILLIALLTGHAFPGWTWVLLVPFGVQDLCDAIK